MNKFNRKINLLFFRKINIKRIKMAIDFLLSSSIIALTLFNLFYIREKEE